MLNTTRNSVKGRARSGTALKTDQNHQQQPLQIDGPDGQIAPHLHMQSDTQHTSVVYEAARNDMSGHAPRGPPTERALLTPADIEVIYGIPQSTQAKARMSGDTWQFIKRGRSVLAFRSDVEGWLRGKLRRSTSDVGTAV